MAKVSKDHIDKFFDYGIDMDSRTIYMGSATYTWDDDETGVDFLMAERVIKGLHLLECAAPNGDKPITIIMNNPGGFVYHGLAIYDFIKKCKNFVTIKGYGNVMSMAAYIMQAADERIMSPNSIFMFHAGYDGYGMNHPKIIEKWVDFNRKFLSPRLDQILLTKINEKKKKDGKKPMTLHEFQKHNDFDTIMFADKALEWGLIDSIVSNP